MVSFSMIQWLFVTWQTTVSGGGDGGDVGGGDVEERVDVAVEKADESSPATLRTALTKDGLVTESPLMLEVHELHFKRRGRDHEPIHLLYHRQYARTQSLRMASPYRYTEQS